VKYTARNYTLTPVSNKTVIGLTNRVKLNANLLLRLWVVTCKQHDWSMRRLLNLIVPIVLDDGILSAAGDSIVPIVQKEGH